jgi:hypothetical protein
VPAASKHGMDEQQGGGDGCEECLHRLPTNT